MLPCQRTEAGGQVNDIAATGQRNNKKRAWRQLWPSQKARKAALTTATTTTTGTGVDEQKVDILILEKYIENHFFCVLRFWFYFICCRTHTYTHTTLLVDCLHTSWPIGAASASAAVARWPIHSYMNWKNIG